jgi:hypothetical protein
MATLEEAKKLKMDDKPKGCNYYQMSQQWQRTQPQMGFFLTFWLFHRNSFFKDFFCNMFFKIFIIPPIYHIICVNSFWIDMNLLKLYKFY